MSRARFGWLLGLSLGLGFLAAALARVVHARRSDLGRRGQRPARIEPLVIAPAPVPAPVPTIEVPEAAVAHRRSPTTVTLPVQEDLNDHVVIDLTDGATWTTPVDGECPEGFPIKAKLSSGIFHLPGMSAYARTHPDRCYATADDALVDGLRAAKR